MKTWVLPLSRRKAFECKIRSRSRWNGVRRRQSSSSRRRPRVSYECTASGDSQRSSCSRTRVAKASATVPARFGIESRLDDDRDGSAVGAPRRTRHVRSTLGAQKADDSGDLLRLGEAAERAARADTREYLLTRVIGASGLLVGKAPVAEPRLGRGRAGRDGVAPDALLRVQVRNEAREREDGRLRHGVVRHAGRRSLAGGRGDVDDHAALRLAHPGEHGADAADVAHYVQLPHRVPLLVGQVVERHLVRLADVVDEAVDRAGFGHESFGRPRIGQVGNDAVRRARVGTCPFHALRVPAGHDDACAFGGEQLRRLEADPGRRTGDETHAIAQAEIHGTGSVIRPVTTLLLVRHGETDWNREGRWQGHSDTHLNEIGRAQAERVAGELDGVDVVYSSDLARARETAEIIAGRSGLPVRLDARLRERSFGAWEGLSAAEIEAEFRDAHLRWLAGEGPGADDAEPFDAFGQRVQAALRELLQRHPDERVLVVAHGGTVRVIHALAGGLDYVRDHRSIPGVPNCVVAE